ncbi:MAG: tRNA (adenosine(37)-N6)-threonylcarbamoyltransferase complex ATPase subunit type 1 TsaE [Hyphomicrobium sp.]
MPASHVILNVTEPQLVRLAEEIAFAAQPGDLIALSGGLGAGKTTLARALISALLGGAREEIPSPTFTLVQTYATPRMAVAHFDLYRLNDPSEFEELGLDHALKNGLALIEWPERAHDALPDSRLDVLLEDESGQSAVVESGTRRITLTGHGDWGQRLERLVAMHAMIRNAGIGGEDCALRYLQGDASVRRYARLTCSGGSGAIIMDWPQQPDGPPVRGPLPYSRIAHLAENVRPFVAIAGALRAAGLSAPEIYAQDLDRGLLLLEDLGDRLFGREVETGGSDQTDLWRTATDVLVALREAPPAEKLPIVNGTSHRLPAYDHGAFGIEVELLLDWYWPAALGTTAPADARAEFAALWKVIIERLCAQPAGWVLRDCHSPNLVWLPDRKGIARIGIIDFQDAMRGPPAYDLVSLLQDARIDVAPELEAHLFDHYCAEVTARQTGFDRDAFTFAYAALGAQRSSKILGIFARLAQRDGKPSYLRHIPRLWRYLERDLAHCELSALRGWYDRHMPADVRQRKLA